MEQDRVTFLWKDYRHNHRQKTMTERKFFLREFFASDKGRSRSGWRIHAGKVTIAQVEGGSHDARTVEGNAPAASPRNLGNQAVSVESAEGAADLGALLFRILATGLQMNRRSEFGADVAVGKAPQTVFTVHDGLEEFGVLTSSGLKPQQDRPAASFFRVVIRSRSRLASVDHRQRPAHSGNERWPATTLRDSGTDKRLLCAWPPIRSDFYLCAGRTFGL